MKKLKRPARKEKRSTRNGATRGPNRRRDRDGNSSIRRRRHPKTELEAAIQRFVDLYDFAPIAYVSFDRAGRIEEANLAATELLGEPRDLLIGRPFAFYVADLDAFLRHLLHCRTSEQKVKTELQLKTRKGARIPAELFSTPITSTTRNGALLYQTAIMDLSERKRAEQALRESKQRLQATYERAPIGIIESSPEGKYVGANEEFCRILGYRKQELLQRGIKDVTHKEDYSGDIKLHRQLVAGEIPFYEIEKRYVRKDGAVIWAQILRSIVRGADGTPLYTIGAVRDVTEHKAAEEKVKWLAAYPRDNPNPILEFDLETNAIYYANPATYESFPDLQRLQLRHPFVVRVLQAARPLLEGRTKAVHAEINIGKTCYAVTAVRIPKIRRLRVYSIDITQRKRAEDRFRLAVESSPSAMIMVDKMGKITLVNSQTERLFGYNREELIGKSVDLLVPQRFRHRHADYRAGFSAAPQARAMGAGRDLYGLRKDGSEVPIEIGVNPIEVGGQTLILSSIVDITARKKAEAALQRSKELLEKLVRQRTEALRLANTDLKSEIERRKGLEGEILAVSDREQQRLGQELHDGVCQHLTAVAFMARSVALRLKNHRVIEVSDIEKIAQLVNQGASDMRNLSRALHQSDVDAPRLTDALQDLVDREIWRTPCRLEVKPSFHLEDDTTAAQLYRIAREAVINANKHAQAREIVVRLERSPGGMVLRITDDGVGFSNGAELRHGLGFHIMNYRAHLMGGRLEIDSPKRGGTRVSCYLSNKALQSRKKENARSGLPGKIAKALTALI